MDAGIGETYVENKIRTYLIVDATDLDAIDFTQVMQSSKETCRLSVDESKALIKYIGDMPSSLASINSRSEEYTHDEVLEILATDAWNAPIETTE